MADPLMIIAKYAALIAVAALVASIGAPILAMLGFPILPSVLLNLMLLHLGGSALLGRISMKWLALPAAAYAAWGIAVVLNRLDTDRTIRGVRLESRIDVPVAPDVDLIFDKGDSLAYSVRRYFIGGRVFQGDGELLVFKIQNPKESAKIKCRDPKYQKYGQEITSVEMKSGIVKGFNDCVFARKELGPISGLIFTRLKEYAPGDRPGHRYVIYAIDEQSVNGEVRRVGQFSEGRIRRWWALPIFSTGCSSEYDAMKHAAPNWCWFKPFYDLYYYAIGKDRKIIAAGDSGDPFGPAVRTLALAELLGRATRDSPPEP